MDLAILAHKLNAMDDRILNKRLQRYFRNQNLTCRIGYAPGDLKLILVALLLQAHIGGRMLQLLFERNQLSPPA
ncbi:hypothetical protein D9M71_774570 [compost metagenome]